MDPEIGRAMTAIMPCVMPRFLRSLVGALDAGVTKPAAVRECNGGGAAYTTVSQTGHMADIACANRRRCHGDVAHDRYLVVSRVLQIRTTTVNPSPPRRAVRFLASQVAAPGLARRRSRAATVDARLDTAAAPLPVAPATVTATSVDVPMRFRSIWISDIHLGTVGCQAERLLDFLRRTESEYLYLVGDIIDGWQLRRKWYWHRSHNDVVQKVLRKARKGTRVVYVPGNHDEAARHFLDLAFGDIVIREEAVHITALGKRLLVIHGDRFDGVVQHAKWLAHFGDLLYTFTLKLNHHFNAFRAKAGLPYWSLAQFLKHKVKNAVSYIVAFEQAVADEARSRQFDGVVCGHIHKAEMRDIGGVLYCNDGDWVDSLTALVEMESGELRILSWHDILQPTAADDGTRAGAAERPVDYVSAPG
jgi:UDP-2,3-diacylglucosamine pyrophosphatase LpxH